MYLLTCIDIGYLAICHDTYFQALVILSLTWLFIILYSDRLASILMQVYLVVIHLALAPVQCPLVKRQKSTPLKVIFTRLCGLLVDVVDLISLVNPLVTS